MRDPRLQGTGLVGDLEGDDVEEERNHQGLDNELIVANDAVSGSGKVVRRDRLGGIFGFYHREAA